MSDATRKAEMGTWLGLKLHFYRLQTRPEMTPDFTQLQEKDSWIFKSNSLFFIRKYFYKFIGTSAFIWTASRKAAPF